MELLSSYRWPGNVRELRHVIERACVLCNGPTILQEHFSDEIVSERNGIESNVVSKVEIETLAPSTVSLPVAPKYVEPMLSEQERIIEALRVTGGNKSKAAKILGFDRSTLYRKIKRYSL